MSTGPHCVHWGMEPLRIALIQSDLYWENAELNRNMFSWKIRDLSGETDLIILPEMFTSGFSLDPAGHAEDATSSPTIDWLKGLSAETGAAITGSLALREAGHYVNRLVWVEPDGSVAHYDKRHLFTLAGEDQTYQPGQTQLVRTWKGWRICPLICYDLRFPVWSRNTTGYDVLLYVANWPEARSHHWSSLLRARAIENQCYVLAVNRIGRDPNGLNYRGDSQAIDYNGDVLAQATRQEITLRLTLDHEAMHTYRGIFAFLDDQDAFQLTS